MNKDAEFEAFILQTDGPDLLKFIAREIHSVQSTCRAHAKALEGHAARLKELEKVEKHRVGIAVGGGAALISIIGGIVYGFLKWLGK